VTKPTKNHIIERGNIFFSVFLLKIIKFVVNQGYCLYICKVIKKNKMKKIEIEIPEGHKEVIKRTENGVVIEWVKVDKEQEMRDFLKPFLTNLLLVKDDRYPNSVFYKQDGEVIFELEKIGHDMYFWVDYYKIWSVFYIKFDLNYNETQSLIKIVVEYTLNLRGITPFFGE